MEPDSWGWQDIHQVSVVLSLELSSISLDLVGTHASEPRCLICSRRMLWRPAAMFLMDLIAALNLLLAEFAQIAGE